jgi:hypothetical protein
MSRKKTSKGFRRAKHEPAKFPCKTPDCPRRAWKMGWCSRCYPERKRTRLPAPRREPEEPTDHGPGTEGKILVMARRASLGQRCFHPHDANFADLAVDG